MERSVSPGCTTYSTVAAGATAVTAVGTTADGAGELETEATAATVGTTIVGRPPAAPFVDSGPPWRVPRETPTKPPIAAAATRTSASQSQNRPIRQCGA